MKFLFWVAAFCTLGPRYDPLAEEVATQEALQVLPAARHTGDLADMWFAQVVNMQVSGGGIETFDPQRLSSHGRSAYQLRTLRGRLDITDVARPGEALVDFSPFFLSRVAYQSMWTDRPGFRLAPSNLGAGRTTQAWAQVGKNRTLGGPRFFPRGLFDRDPSFAYGAPEERRALARADEVAGRLTTAIGQGRFSLSGERIEHTHRYLTLKTPEDASRTTLALNATHPLGPWQLSAEAVYQGRHRERAGAESRFTDALTHTEGVHAALALLEAEGPALGPTQLYVGLLLAYKDRAERGSRSPRPPSDLEAEGLWLAPPKRPETGFQKQMHLSLKWRGPLRSKTFWTLATDVESGSYVRHFASWGDATQQTFRGRTVRTTRWQEGLPVGARLVHARTQGTLDFPFHHGRAEVFAGLDVADGATATRALRFVSPAGGAKYSFFLSGGEGFVLLRHEPELLTAQLTDFMAREGPQGTVYLPSRGGQPPILSGMTGGMAHDIRPGLRRPSISGFAFGTRTLVGGPFEFTWAGVGQFLEERFTVNDQPRSAVSPHAFADPGGDGRGEDFRISGGGQALIDNDPEPSVTATKRYLLTNEKQLSRYLGLELNLSSLPGRRWFFNLGGAAYLSSGRAPWGNFVGRNDPGVIGEQSAGYNNRFQAYGRYDHDRSYSLKLLTGFLFSERLSVALAARYRDGQPFARVVVDPDLQAGPEALMGIRRGRARHTFHMTWDARLRAVLMSRPPFKMTFVVDVFNLLGSATEILEDNRTGPTFRQSLEAIPDRSLFASLAIAYDE